MFVSGGVAPDNLVAPMTWDACSPLVSPTAAQHTIKGERSPDASGLTR